MRNDLMMSLSLAALILIAPTAFADPQIGGGRPGRGAPIDPGGGAGDSPVHDEKPEIAAKKAFAAGQKSLDKAKAFALQAEQAQSADKRIKAQEKANEAYYKAIDQFTEALSNKGDLTEAWRDTGYVHLRLGAYVEALDDYNHVLKLQPDSLEAVESRAEAYLHLDRLEEVQIAYMDLFNHARPLADQLMALMRQWVAAHRADPQGMRPATVEAFARWVDERVSAAGS